MADFNHTPDGGDYSYDFQSEFSTALQPNTLGKLTNGAGALVSLVLIAGIGVWGYKLLVRDVSGIPVVKAAVGEMRVRPDEPGGQLAKHQGLSVNSVAALGTAGAPADELRLAPSPVELTEEDQITLVAMVADVPQDGTAEAAMEGEIPDVAGALQSGDVTALVEQLTAGVAPMDATSDQPADIEQAAVVVEPELEPAPANSITAPGVRNSLRPRKRPNDVAMVVQASLRSDAPAAAKVSTAEIDPASLAKGTRLAQLGAFDSPEVAREQWDQLNIRFSAYLDGKQRVVQKATSGGRVFYRLRAHGFEDIADARRFCSALVAENADCIPVVTR